MAAQEKEYSKNHVDAYLTPPTTSSARFAWGSPGVDGSGGSPGAGGLGGSPGAGGLGGSPSVGGLGGWPGAGGSGCIW